MKAKIGKWGQSAALRIPAAILELTHLGIKDLVNVRVERGSIVIEAVRTKHYDLERLVQRINSKNRHTSLDFGPAAGKEVS